MFSYETDPDPELIRSPDSEYGNKTAWVNFSSSTAQNAYFKRANYTENGRYLY